MRSRRTDRGQTTIDFALGASILLVGVGFVLLMAPNLFTPFAAGQPADPLTSDRLADHLVADELVADGATSELDMDATEAFFHGDGDTLSAELRATEFRSVNVTMTNQSTGSSVESRGPPLPEESGQVTQAQRVVDYDGETHWLTVQVW